ncbi:MAG: DinB family protein [Puniceicoccaceae bacterium]
MNTLIDANLACLGQGIEFLQKLPAELYSRKCPELFNSSIGGHLRHNLDHYLAFVSGQPTGKVDYDDRQRDEAIEVDREAAIGVLQELVDKLESMRTSVLDSPLKIRMDDGGDSTWSQTTLRRELQFLLSHSIHHYALVVSIATRFGVRDFPEGFGVAPSTIHYLEKKGA